MASAVALDQLIAITPGVCGGKPHIAGRRITVQNIAIWHERMGLSADEIATDYNLTLSEVHAALAYYFAYRDEIEHVPTAVTNGLRLRGVDATTTQETGMLGSSDEALLNYALSLERVLFSQD